MSYLHPHASRMFLAIAMLATMTGDLCSFVMGSDLSGVRKRAEAGNVQDEIELAADYMVGQGVPQDPAQAAYWYEKAAGAGNSEAEDQIGYFYETGIGVRTDIDRAVHWYRLAAASGQVRAKVNLGMLYLKGIGVPRDSKMAQRLFEDAVRKHFGAGATCLGSMYLLGLGVSTDMPTAEKWYVKGMKLDDPSAAYDLAILYSTSSGHRHDFGKALSFLRRAVARGYVPAMHALGMLLINHPELRHSGKQPQKLLETSADAGNWRSSVMLGILARDGKLEQPDPAAAYYRFTLATLQGGEAARKLLASDLRTLAAKIGSEQKAALDARAREWLSHHPFEFVFLIKDDDPARNFPVATLADAVAAPPTPQ